MGGKGKRGEEGVGEKLSRRKGVNGQREKTG